MLSLVLSVIAFFVASFFIKRWLDEMGMMPEGYPRGKICRIFQ